MFVSMVTSRLGGPLNFYDEALIQDGHELHRIRPPLDLQGWQDLPIGAIANPRPAVIGGFSEGELRKALDEHPYHCFPVFIDGRLQGIVTREGLLSALKRKVQPELLPAVVCSPEQSVHEVGNKFLDSPAGVIVVMNEGTGAPSGIITLHDLLRAQAAILD
jgi:CIC family chloride channel protein